MNIDVDRYPEIAETALRRLTGMRNIYNNKLSYNSLETTSAVSVRVIEVVRESTNNFLLSTSMLVLINDAQTKFYVSPNKQLLRTRPKILIIEYKESS